ncbi:MAG TPA: uracil-DNA glycosylase family protein [Verrucomicrobiae bacterium]|jgi:single-strand selective monofunctional uracil DNA glycosylase|nr:uracil-DNA glycosylase family protein [Verrucomicrobiae bacterium]
MALEEQLVDAARDLGLQAGKLRFRAPITHVYNPLAYAWNAHEIYLRRFGGTEKEVVFLGMNPGPFGMAQTGVPFGEIPAVRDWMKIRAVIERPAEEHPRRPIQGFDCPRSEISGQRLWGLFGQRFGTAENFFARHFVVNYCPLAFLEEGGRNRTPDKLPAEEKERLEHICDAHLKRVLKILRPKWLIGVGDFATRRAENVCSDLGVRIGRILHPSPASPAANRDWSGTATGQLQKLGIWK